MFDSAANKLKSILFCLKLIVFLR